mmetsp:Transcript_15618/g.40022  ORF Transcript_15618/g.40022 Transcript_15618/m.40022 type:complete len:89 (+) Transcript_15618:168-434(+)
MIIGTTSLSPTEVESFFKKKSKEFKGNTYNLLANNCNHFSDAICFELTGNHLPAWVNRLASVGDRFRNLIPAEYQSPQAAPVGPDAKK